MTWITIALFVISKVPDLISTVEAIIAALHGQGTPALMASRDRLSAAVQTGDLSQVSEAISNEAKCLGIACPMETK